jgi:hypothetical protein
MAEQISISVPNPDLNSFDFPPLLMSHPGSRERGDDNLNQNNDTTRNLLEDCLECLASNVTLSPHMMQT